MGSSILLSRLWGLLVIMLRKMSPWVFVYSIMWLLQLVICWMKGWDFSCSPSPQCIEVPEALVEVWVDCGLTMLIFQIILSSQNWAFTEFWLLIGMSIMAMPLRKCFGRILVFFSSRYTGKSWKGGSCLVINWLCYIFRIYLYPYGLWMIYHNFYVYGTDRNNVHTSKH